MDRMKKFFIAILSCFYTANVVIGQTTLDTLYYDKDWKGCEKTFATYYRVYALSADNNLKKKFRDYYITGELQSEGEYINIDKYDDSKSVFDGEFVVSGPDVDRLMARVNLADNESLYYFQKMLINLGIDEALRNAGVKDGETIRFNDWEFAWYE